MVRTMLTRSRTRGQVAPWLLAGLPGLVSAALITGWLEQRLAPGAGWVWLVATIALGGLGVDLLRRHHGHGTSCAIRPRIRPLQVSGLALQALGVVLYHYGQQPAFQATLPTLAVPWLPLLCIVGGLIMLGLVSIASDCRDAELRGRV